MKFTKGFDVKYKYQQNCVTHLQYITYILCVLFYVHIYYIYFVMGNVVKGNRDSETNNQSRYKVTRFSYISFSIYTQKDSYISYTHCEKTIFEVTKRKNYLPSC